MRIYCLTSQAFANGASDSAERQGHEIGIGSLTLGRSEKWSEEKEKTGES
jgi:hypothetical protein